MNWHCGQLQQAAAWPWRHRWLRRARARASTNTTGFLGSQPPPHRQDRAGHVLAETSSSGDAVAWRRQNDAMVVVAAQQHSGDGGRVAAVGLAAHGPASLAQLPPTPYPSWTQIGGGSKPRLPRPSALLIFFTYFQNFIFPHIYFPVLSNFI